MVTQNPYLELPSLDLSTIRGTSFKYHFVYKVDGSAVDLAGCSAEMKWKKSYLSQNMMLWIKGSGLTYGGGSAEFSLTGGTGGVGSIQLNVNKNGVSGTTGGILIQFDPTTSESLPTLTGLYDIEITDTNGKRSKAARGRMTVLPSVYYRPGAVVPCSYNVGSLSRNVGVCGGFGFIGVTANRQSCPWEATSNVEWLNIESSPIGVGNGRVDYAWATNGSTTPRVGTISVAGYTITITQTGGAESEQESVVSGAGFEPPVLVTQVENSLEPVGDTTSHGYRNNTIARWAEPLCETYTTTKQIPVFAYHIEGINRLDFSLNGGEVRTVTTRTYNSEIGATCYNLVLDPSTVPDNEFNELRVSVYPISGIPQVLQGEIKGPDARDNITFGHHSFFFATNAGGSLRTPNYYVEGVCGDDANSGITSTAPKKTIEAALMASGAGNTVSPRHVDGTIIHLMDNGGITTDYYLGTPGLTLFDGINQNIVFNLKRYVTIKPFENSKVVIRGKGNSAGLRLCKYKFENLRFDIPAGSPESARPFSFENCGITLFTNPANGITYEVGVARDNVHMLMRNCYYTPNYQSDYDWSFQAPEYTPPANALTEYPGVAFPKMTQLPGESNAAFKTRKVKFWYEHSGWTFNPHWGTSSDSENAAYESRNGNAFNTNWFVGAAIVGCTWEYLGAFTKPTGQIYLVQNTYSNKAFLDVWRDAHCLINCTHERVIGHPLNVRVTLTNDVIGLGLSGSVVGAREHADILQKYTGKSQRNCVLYGSNAIHYHTQGPFLTSGADRSGIYEHPPIELDATPDDYEPYWSQYRDAESGMIRDIAIDKCVFLKNPITSNMSFMVGGNLSGNYYIKDSIIGEANSTDGVIKYGFSTTEDEHNEKYLDSPLRPSKIENSVNGGFTAQGPNRCLLFTMHRSGWNGAGNPNYWVSPEIKSGFTSGYVIYDFTGTKPNPIVVPGLTAQL
jgi:hypothetical protein